MPDTIEDNTFLRSYGRVIGIAAGISAIGALGYAIYRLQKRSTDSQELEDLNEPSAQAAIKKKDEGNKYFKQKNYAEALQAFQKGIELCPEDAYELRSNLFQNIAVILEYNKDYHGCAENCTNAINLNRRYLKALKRRSHAYSKINRHKEALIDIQVAQILQNAPTTEPTDDIENSVQILATKKKDEYLREHKGELIPISQDVVLEWLTSSLIHDPFLKKMKQLSTASNLYEEALIALKNDKYNEVLGLAMKEFSTDGSQYRIESSLLAARFYFYHNQEAKGKEMLHRFREMYDILDDPTIYTDFYVAYHILQMIYVEDITATRNSIANECHKIAPSNSDPFFVLGLCCFNDESLQDSVHAFIRVKEINPDHPYNTYYLLYSKFIEALKSNNMGQVHQCVVQFEDYIRLHDAPAYAHFMACRIYSQMQSFELAIEELNKALQVKPDYVDAIYLKSLINVDNLLVQTEDGIKIFMQQVEMTMNEIIEIEPSFAEPYKMLAKIFVDKKDFPKAFECYEKAIKLTRKPQDLTLLMAEYIMAEARSEAINYLDKYPA